MAFPLDLTDKAAITETVAAVGRQFGRIDCAVLNAGTYTPDNVAAFDADMIAEHFQVNVVGTMTAMGALLPVMTAQKAGRIAVVASVAGYRGLPNGIAYGGTKAALINMVEAMKPECDTLGIRLQLICPGFVKTRLTDKNTFHMPFLIDADAAAIAIERGLARDAFEITFPWPMKMIMKLLQLLPYGPFFAITRKLVNVARL